MHFRETKGGMLFNSYCLLLLLLNEVISIGDAILPAVSIPKAHDNVGPYLTMLYLSPMIRSFSL